MIAGLVRRAVGLLLALAGVVATASGWEARQAVTTAVGVVVALIGLAVVFHRRVRFHR